MAEAFITRRGGGKKTYAPLFSGQSNLILSEDGKSGYLELLTSGTLKWLGGIPPKSADLFCVGGGGGGGPSVKTAAGAMCGAGGGSGYTHTVTGASLPVSCEVSIGSGGASCADGGQTSIGNICVAAGGKTPAAQSYGGTPVYNVGGDGGSAGGNSGFAFTNGATTMYRGGNGGSNGGAPNNSGTYAPSLSGVSQGTPTTDLLGRIHAGGGGGAPGGAEDRWGDLNFSTPGVGGASHFTSGKGTDISVATKTATGGGGYGGGGAGGFAARAAAVAGAPGGQGFAMIGWGDYVTLYQQQGG